ncbi:MAG: hypothetical protein ACXU8A_11695 [Burkholderiaceae bacterium]
MKIQKKMHPIGNIRLIFSLKKQHNPHGQHRFGNFSHNYSGLPNRNKLIRSVTFPSIKDFKIENFRKGCLQ